MHALVLLGVGISTSHHGSGLSNAPIGLAQGHIVLLGQLAQLLDGDQKQFGVGREGDVLRLHRGIDGDPGQIALLKGAAVVGDAQAFL